jgi:uncharacterized iron-regulated protein
MRKFARRAASTGRNKIVKPWLTGVLALIIVGVIWLQSGWVAAAPLDRQTTASPISAPSKPQASEPQASEPQASESKTSQTAVTPGKAPVITTATGEPRSFSQVMTAIETAAVIYLGETHDRAADHIVQLEIIKVLTPKYPRLAIGLEMFQRPYQSVLDDYLADRITEAELLEKTEYSTRWGFDWELYAPIVRYAKAQKLQLIALNTPQEVTRKVSRQGLENLSDAEQKFIPPIADIQIGSQASAPAYRQMLRQVFEEFHQASSKPADPTITAQKFERFWLAQILWDETMAAQIAQVLPRQQSATPAQPIVVLAGSGHLVYGYGIPSRVQRRQPQPIAQAILLLSPTPALSRKDVTGQPIADFLWPK